MAAPRTKRKRDRLGRIAPFQITVGVLRACMWVRTVCCQCENVFRYKILSGRCERDFCRDCDKALRKAARTEDTPAS